VSLTVAINGLLIGSLYGLVGMGLSLLAGVVRLINLAQGDILVGGAYLAIALHGVLGWDPLWLLPIVAVAIFCGCYVVQKWLLNSLVTREPLALLVVTFGLSLLLESLYQELFGANPASLPAFWGDTGFTVLGVRIETLYVVAFITGAVLAACTWFLLYRTHFGRTVRAAAADASTARLLGVDVERVFALTFGLAGVLAAAAGVILAVGQSVSPTSGLSLLVFSFTVMVICGIGNVIGAVVAGMFVGLLQAIAGAVIGQSSTDLAVYVFLLVFLIVFPSGILKRRELGIR